MQLCFDTMEELVKYNHNWENAQMYASAQLDLEHDGILEQRAK